MQSTAAASDDPRVAEWAAVVDEQIASLLKTMGLAVVAERPRHHQLQGTFHVASLGFTSEVISGYVMLAIAPSVAQASLRHQGVPEERWCVSDSVGEACNMFAGRIKAALLRYGVRAMIATPSVMEVTNVLMPVVSNRFSSQRLLELEGGCMGVTVEVSPVDDFQLREEPGADVQVSEGVSLFL